MTSLLVTLKNRVTLKRELLQHLGVGPGDRVNCEKLPGGELRIRAAPPGGTIDLFFHALDGRVSLPGVLTIEQMNVIAATGWASWVAEK